MDQDNNLPHGVSRRSFIKGSAIGAIGVASTGFLTGCSPKETPTADPSDSSKKTSYDVAPPSIPDKDIVKTINTEVLVVGGGTAGMFAALSAAEAGSKTMLIEKASAGAVGPAWMAAIDSSVQKKAGVKIDKEEVVAELCRYGGHLVDQRLIRLWADKSGAVMDWFVAITDAGGLKTMVETDLEQGFYKSYPVGHVTMPLDTKAESFPTGGIGSQYYIPVMVKKAQEMGVDIHFKTALVQLIRKDNDRVTGAVTTNENGEYVKINASKGIILCTGGFSRDTEMVTELCPRALATSLNVAPPSNTGDGMKAAIWAGAAIDPHHSMMVFDRGVVLPGKKLGPPWQGAFLQLGSQPFLKVNQLGERFVNEDLPYDYCWDAALLQPGQTWWQVWDANWQEDVKRFHTIFCSRIIPHPNAPPRAGLENVEAEIAKLAEMGIIKKADSIEELAKQMGVPADVFTTTVGRYNELTRQGKDLDFGKTASRLSALNKAPYYAANLAGLLICNLNGLRINTKLEVLDKDHKVIPGLYAAGNDSGSFFAFNYPELLGGIALGRTATFGRLAGLSAAGVSF